MAGRPALSWPAVSSSAPSKDSPPASDSSKRLLAIALPALVALAYGLGHLNWYLGTPLGRVPVLDERENLDLAAATVASARTHRRSSGSFLRTRGSSDGMG